MLFLSFSAGQRLSVALAVLGAAAVVAPGCGGEGEGETAGGSSESDAARFVVVADEAPALKGPLPPSLADELPSTAGPVDPGSLSQRRAAGTSCKLGYRSVAGGTACRAPGAVEAVEREQSEFRESSDQALLDTTHYYALDYANWVIRSSPNDPRTYYGLVRPEECSVVGAGQGRCLIYLWKETYATGYGLGGVDRGVWREYYFVTHIGNGRYDRKPMFLDFIDPYYWECSDTPRANTPRCT